MTRRPILSTAAGTRSDAFGTSEWAVLVAIALIWGSSFLFIAEGLEAFDPMLITLMRVAFGAGALGLFPRSRRPIHRDDWGRIALLGIIWIALPLSMFPIAEQWIDSATAGMLNGAMPLFAGLIAALLLRRLPGRVQVTGLLIGFAGVVLISLPSARATGDAALGVLLVVFATVCYGLSVNLAVPLQQRYGSLPVIWYSQLVALALLAVPGLAGLPGSGWSWSALAAVTALGVLGTGVAFILMANLAGRVGATRASIAIYFVPVVAAIEGSVFRNENVAMVALAGMLLVIGGAYLASRREGPGPLPAEAAVPGPSASAGQARPSVASRNADARSANTNR